jgi:hypothetical protein
MPIPPRIDQAVLDGLLGHEHSGEHGLDLRGMMAGAAKIAIEAMLQRFSGQDTTVIVRITPASPTSGETLFQPVARQLLAARRAELIGRFSPLSQPPGGGFHVTMKRD